MVIITQRYKHEDTPAAKLLLAAGAEFVGMNASGHPRYRLQGKTISLPVDRPVGSLAQNVYHEAKRFVANVLATQGMDAPTGTVVDGLTSIIDDASSDRLDTFRNRVVVRVAMQDAAGDHAKDVIADLQHKFDDQVDKINAKFERKRLQAEARAQRQLAALAPQEVLHTPQAASAEEPSMPEPATVGITKYVCEECQKEFETYTSLRGHKAQHAPLAFSCADCGQGFRRKDHLKRHLADHEEPIVKVKAQPLSPGSEIHAAITLARECLDTIERSFNQLNEALATVRKVMS